MQTILFDLTERSKVITLEIADRRYSLKNGKGFAYLLELLRNPGKRYYAMTLHNAQNPLPEEYRLLAEQSNIERTRQLIYHHDELPPIWKADWQTIREVSARLNFLIEQKALMQQYNDLGALEEVEWEMDFLSQYLGDVVRRDGNLAAFNTSQKKVVRSVNRAVRRAIEQIRSKEEDLGDYLGRQVHAWHILYYTPTGEYELGAGL